MLQPVLEGALDDAERNRLNHWVSGAVQHHALDGLLAEVSLRRGLNPRPALVQVHEQALLEPVAQLDGRLLLDGQPQVEVRLRGLCLLGLHDLEVLQVRLLLRSDRLARVVGILDPEHAAFLLVGKRFDLFGVERAVLVRDERCAEDVLQEANRNLQPAARVDFGRGSWRGGAM